MLTKGLTQINFSISKELYIQNLTDYIYDNSIMKFNIVFRLLVLTIRLLKRLSKTNKHIGIKKTFINREKFYQISFSLWMISRHSFIAIAVPIEIRGRAISIFGGFGRFATILGPFIGGIVAEFIGIRIPFVIQIFFL